MHPAHGYDRTRDYAGLLLRTQPPYAGSTPLVGHGRNEAMLRAVDSLWEMLSSTGVSWIGFYLADDSREQLTLGPRRDKPACSPIGMHGMCGRCYLERRPIIVHDVAALGDNYIACDPRDRSEVVIPLFESGGSCWGVLDADSYDIGAFGIADVEGLTGFVESRGLSALQARPAQTLQL
jgi:putative methionine-R-sulfoxide reductase with GAF domain